MKRIVKAPEIRRAEILQVAKNLFTTKGYEQTSVEAIIQAVGIAKGTFYYYFKAKKDILTALVELIATDIAAHFQFISDVTGLSAIDKLQMMFTGSEKQAKIDPVLMEAIHQPENRELQERLNIKTILLIAPIIAKVVEEGNQEGVFQADAPLETVQFIMAASAFVLESGLFSWSTEKQQALREALQGLAEKALGARPGVLRFIATPEAGGGESGAK